MYDVVIIGGGPAGLAAAAAVKKAGVDNIVIYEQESKLGGILNQCIHTGYGLELYKESLTGTELAQKLIDDIQKLEIPFKLDTTVIDINKNKDIVAVNGIDGIISTKTKTVILSTGCKEMPRSVINIPGAHCAGIFTAGAAQKLINLDGYMPGKEIVIFGSGDIGLIMARRLTIEGAKVKAVIERKNKYTGSEENMEKCLKDFSIPLMLNCTIKYIHGDDRVNGVTVIRTDDNEEPLESSEMFIECDTVLLSVDTIPDAGLAAKAGIKISSSTGGLETDGCMNTSVDGIFACGNIINGKQSADEAILQGYNAGEKAAEYIKTHN